MQTNRSAVKEALEVLEFPNEKYRLYKAGFNKDSRGFPCNFTRDSFRAAKLLNDSDMIYNQLMFSAERIAKETNSFNGAEPGKPHHEYPPFIMPNGLSTEYNACDVGAELLIAAKDYFDLTGDQDTIERLKEPLNKTTDYMLSHILDKDLKNIKKGAYIEDPKFSGATDFGLGATYWKDSVIKDRDQGLEYPVVFSLVQAQVVKALKSAAVLLKRDELYEKAENLKTYLTTELFDNEKGMFYIAIDEKGKIAGTTSDSLHALYYLEKGDLDQTKLEKIVNSSIPLETPVGYRVMSSEDGKDIKDKYHVETVWPWEQGYIHMAAKKHNLKRAEVVSSRVKTSGIMDSYIKDGFYPEILELGDNIKAGGCHVQLWSVAVMDYFNKNL